MNIDAYVSLSEVLSRLFDKRYTVFVYDGPGLAAYIHLHRYRDFYLRNLDSLEKALGERSIFFFAGRTGSFRVFRVDNDTLAIARQVSYNRVWVPPTCCVGNIF